VHEHDSSEWNRSLSLSGLLLIGIGLPYRCSARTLAYFTYVLTVSIKELNRITDDPPSDSPPGSRPERSTAVGRDATVELPKED